MWAQKSVFGLGPFLSNFFQGDHHGIGDPACGGGGAIRIAGKQVVGAQQPPIALPQGGTNADSEARAAISMVINSLRAHGLISN